jgi:hypothetical protein
MMERLRVAQFLSTYFGSEAFYSISTSTNSVYLQGVYTPEMVEAVIALTGGTERAWINNNGEIRYHEVYTEPIQFIFSELILDMPTPQ